MYNGGYMSGGMGMTGMGGYGGGYGAGQFLLSEIYSTGNDSSAYSHAAVQISHAFLKYQTLGIRTSKDF